MSDEIFTPDDATAERIADAVRTWEQRQDDPPDAVGYVPRPPRVELVKVTGDAIVTDGPPSFPPISSYPAQIAVWHQDTQTWVLDGDEIRVRGANQELLQLHWYYRAELVGVMSVGASYPLYEARVFGVDMDYSDGSGLIANVARLNIYDPMTVTYPDGYTAKIGLPDPVTQRVLTNVCPTAWVTLSGVTLISKLTDQYQGLPAFATATMPAPTYVDDETGCCA